MSSPNLSTSRFLPMNRHQDYPLIVRAAGRRLYAADGREYLDGASGGVGAANIGHGVPEVLAAIAEQSRTLCHANASLFLNQPALELADLVIEHFAPAGMERVYFVSTGTEANELCIKLARVCHLNRGEPLRHKIVTRWGGYHGSSLATLAYAGRSSRRRQFDPYYFPATRIAPAYYLRHGAGLDEEEYAAVAAAALEEAIVREGPETVSCFVAEPLVNTMGACPAPAGYFQRVREICDRYGVLLVCDEVVTGFGRTGRNFGIDHWEVSPDLMACGKGISGAYTPLACAIAGRTVWEALERDPSGATVVGHTHRRQPAVGGHRPRRAALHPRPRPGAPFRGTRRGVAGAAAGGSRRPPARRRHPRQGAAPGGGAGGRPRHAGAVPGRVQHGPASVPGLHGERAQPVPGARRLGRPAR